MDKVVFEVTREYVSSWAGRNLTDTEWSVMSDEISEFLDYYTKDEIPRLLSDLDNIVAEGSK